MFQVLLHDRGFIEFNHATVLRRKIRVMQCTIGWKFDGIDRFGRSMVIDISGSSHKKRFCSIFPCYEIFMGKPIHFSCDVDYRRVGIS